MKGLKKSKGTQIIRVFVVVVAIISYSLHSIFTEGAKKNGTLTFDVAAVVAISELVKLGVTIFFLVRQSELSIATKGLYNIGEQSKAAIPALLYAFNNQMAFWMLLQMDPGTMQLLSNFKIIPTCLLSVLILKQEISRTQYKALGLLLLGMIALHSADRGVSKVGSTYLGLLQAFLYCVVSGVAGVWCEKVLCDGSLHIQNFHLYIWGCLVNFVWLALHLKPDSISGLWDGWAIANILNQALTGLLISIVLKYAGNVDKLFVVAASVIPAGLAAYFLFGYAITVRWLFSAGIIVTAISIYVGNHDVVTLIRTILLVSFLGASSIAFFSQLQILHEQFSSAKAESIFANLPNLKNSLQIPEVILKPSQTPNYTLGFLQTLCKNDHYPLTRSCFYYPTDLWPGKLDAVFYIHLSHHLILQGELNMI